MVFAPFHFHLPAAKEYNFDEGQPKMNVFTRVKVRDAFLYAFLAVAVSFSTLGYGFGDAIYLGLIALFGLFLAVRVLSGRYSSRDIAVFVIMVGLGVLLAYHTHKYTALLSSVLLVAACGVDANKLLREYYIIKAISFIALFLFAAVGIFDTSTVQHYRAIAEEFETRIYINGASGNVVHLGLCTISALYFYLNYQRKTWAPALWFMALNVVLYLTFTRSLTGVIMTTFAVILFSCCSHMPRIERTIVRFAPFIPVALLAYSVVMGLSYGSSEIADFVNRLMTGRTAYDHYFLTTYGVSLFGADYSDLISEGYFDNSYVYSLVIYGLVFTALLYGSVTVLLWRIAYREGSPQESLLLLVFLIYGLAESIYPSAVVNPSLFLLTAVLFDRRDTSLAVKRDRTRPEESQNATDLGKAIRLGTSSRMEDEAR